jgi:ADP-heptose:LPS heptosyltransferase
VAGLDFRSLERIAVFRALQLGDLLCAVPALRALRAAAPQARITLVGLPWSADFVERYRAYVDEHLVFPGFPGLPETAPDLAAIPGFFAAAQSRRFDLAIQLHGSGLQTNALMAAMGARRNAGFFLPGQYCPDPELFAEWSEREHEVLRYVRLVGFLGIEPRGEALEFPLAASDFQALRQADAEVPAPGSYACVHPGARLPSRRWPPQRFAEVADGLAAQGLQVVLTGSESERPIVDAVRQAMKAPALDLCGRTGLGALAALVAQARLVVCNDTGISHVAAGVGTPSVVISSGADARRWAPLDAGRHRLLFADAPCRPCGYAICPVEGHPCATGVPAARVLAEALDLCAAAQFQLLETADERTA